MRDQFSAYRTPLLELIEVLFHLSARRLPVVRSCHDTSISRGPAHVNRS
jgi:hypothetical protein